MKQRFLPLFLTAVFLLSLLTGCAKTETKEPEGDSSQEQTQQTDNTQTQQEEQEPEEVDNTVYVDYNGVVEHLFFHPVVAYPEMAFDGDAKSKGIDDYMVTADEYLKILNSLYEKGYVLIDINEIWSEYTDENGQQRMKANTLQIPEGKKPLVLSFDDVNYYEYMLANGFTYKLILGDDGKIWSYGLDPQGKEVISRDLDAVTILDKFVEEHPDFSCRGAKGCFSLTGYEGIFGYRTQTDKDVTDPAELAAFEKNRQAEIAAVKPIIAALKESGWTFGCHTWGHINLTNKSLSRVQTDITRWKAEVGSLVGETSIIFYPYGARPDGGNDVTQSGEVFRYLVDEGFRVFASVGINSYSKIKTDCCAVICDRLHPDGYTLRWKRSQYLQFYDAKDILDLSVRPDLGYDFNG